jgi:hypothetical protein
MGCHSAHHWLVAGGKYLSRFSTNRADTSTASNSCNASAAFGGGAADTKSLPFYVYGNNADALYAGDHNGSVHRFTGVFNGMPVEETTGVWSIAVNAGAILTSLIFDSVSGNIFVGDHTGRLSFIQELASTVGGTTLCPPVPLPQHRQPSRGRRRRHC